MFCSRHGQVAFFVLAMITTLVAVPDRSFCQPSFCTERDGPPFSVSTAADDLVSAVQHDGLSTKAVALTCFAWACSSDVSCRSEVLRDPRLKTWASVMGVVSAPLFGEFMAGLEANALLRAARQIRNFSTGRTEPLNLTEQLAMEQAKANPKAGSPLPVQMNDPRWLASDGWVKMAQNINGVEIHYVMNLRNGMIADFKFLN